jgi:hypothetical protein
MSWPSCFSISMGRSTNKWLESPLVHSYHLPWLLTSSWRTSKVMHSTVEPVSFCACSGMLMTHLWSDPWTGESGQPPSVPQMHPPWHPVHHKNGNGGLPPLYGYWCIQESRWLLGCLCTPNSIWMIGITTTWQTGRLCLLPSKQGLGHLQPRQSFLGIRISVKPFISMVIATVRFYWLFTHIR